MTITHRLDLAHGRCVGVAIPTGDCRDLLSDLHPEEQAVARTMPPERQRNWAAGRVALRTALSDLGVDVHSTPLLSKPLLATDRGAPKIGPGAVGSISHKHDLAVALAARVDGPAFFTIGVDLEKDTAPRIDISRRVLTPDEANTLSRVPEPERGRQVILRLSLKEAIYKALDPHVRRHVGFHEAAINAITADGSTRVTLALKEKEGPFQVDARWVQLDSYFLTTAYIVAQNT
jgi:enterobactin synthetase component D